MSDPKKLWNTEERALAAAKLTRLVRYTDPNDEDVVGIEFQLDAYPGWTFGTAGESNWEISPGGFIDFLMGWSNWGAYWVHDPYVYHGICAEHFELIKGEVPAFKPDEWHYGGVVYAPVKGLEQINHPFEMLQKKLNKTVLDFGF